ncbi:MAG: hypothetical protein AMXMBFR13_40040 [Phycisphaerae bacterium]
MRNRLRVILFVATAGTLLQTTGGCEEVLAPIVANLVSSVVLNALLGGLAI